MILISSPHACPNPFLSLDDLESPQPAHRLYWFNPLMQDAVPSKNRITNTEEVMVLT